MERTVAETGLNILLELIRNVESSAQHANQFYQRYYISLLKVVGLLVWGLPFSLVAFCCVCFGFKYLTIDSSCLVHCRLCSFIAAYPLRTCWGF